MPAPNLSRSTSRRPHVATFEAAVLIGAGLICGIGSALVTMRLLRTLLFEVTPGDPMTIAAVAVLLASVGFAACYIPARCATLVDPLMALRSD